ncbi:hypothetical protein KSP40_PGU011256 [Platanthera guangdongensis]|uniref:Uncharacterized protein n=1 Tax=Platanthera guangdongensis TaxID=2320717 RepID=A0ABR2M9Y6_9ASPA
MAEHGVKPDAQLFQLLASLLQQNQKYLSHGSRLTRSPITLLRGIGDYRVESLSNQEEVELREKIEALGIEVTKVPPKLPNILNELEIAAELDRLSAKLDDVDKMISSTMNADPEVRSLLSSTADLWLPVITASADERRFFGVSSTDDLQEEHALPRK